MAEKLPVEWNKQDSCPYCTIQLLRKCRRKLKTDTAVGVMQTGKILLMILKSINILSSKPQPLENAVWPQWLGCWFSPEVQRNLSPASLPLALFYFFICIVSSHS